MLRPRCREFQIMGEFLWTVFKGMDIGPTMIKPPKTETAQEVLHHPWMMDILREQDFPASFRCQMVQKTYKTHLTSILCGYGVAPEHLNFGKFNLLGIMRDFAGGAGGRENVTTCYNNDQQLWPIPPGTWIFTSLVHSLRATVGDQNEHSPWRQMLSMALVCVLSADP